MFLALKMLGYRPFHISELLPHGVRQMQALEEAMVASSTDTPYTRAELDKLFGDYDVSWAARGGKPQQASGKDADQLAVLDRKPVLLGCQRYSDLR